ncbi:MAG: hypothetical protein ACJ74W_22650 [Pyrinomonadaceae bacterium]
MKTKLILILCACLSVVTLTTVRNSSDKAKAAIKDSNKTQQVFPKISKPDPPGTINGAERPELIPDETAYTLFFEMLSGRHTETEIISIQAYLKQSGFDEATSNILITLADELQEQIEGFDAQAKELRRKNWPNPSSSALTRLRVLQNQKETAVRNLISSLPLRLNSTALVAIRDHINKRVKPKVKIIPDAQ